MNSNHTIWRLDSKTPAQACGIEIEGKNKWLTLIQNARKMNDDIPLSKIHEGYHLHEKLIKDFLDTSKTFFDNRDYTKSILFSIFAWEEMSKLFILADHMKIKWEDIPYSEWKKRTSNGKVHSFKLTDITVTTKKRLQARPKEINEKMKMVFAQYGLTVDNDALLNTKDEEDEWIQTFKKLNEVKKLILYNHWNGDEWISFNKITKNYERKIIANVLLELSKFNFFNLINIKGIGTIKATDEIVKKSMAQSRRLATWDFLIDREIMKNILDRIQDFYYNRLVKKE